MNDTTNLDQADEEILSYTVADEALEAAAGLGRAAGSLWQACATSLAAFVLYC